MKEHTSKSMIYIYTYKTTNTYIYTHTHINGKRERESWMETRQTYLTEMWYFGMQSLMKKKNSDILKVLPVFLAPYSFISISFTF